MKFLFRTLLFPIIVTLFLGSCKGEVKETDASIHQKEKAPVKATLIQHTVLSDGHPLAVWEKSPTNPKGAILFVHGRTWSGVPDFDLQVEGEDLSLMDGMVAEGYATYAIDLRGYGGTPRDSTEWNTPNKAAKDVHEVLQWISEKQHRAKVHLFGWSMGSTISLLAAQQKTDHIASLSLFGFWLDLDNRIPEDPKDHRLAKIVNTPEAAASDFIVPGSISQKAIDTYVNVALQADPIKVDWKNLNEYNQIAPTTLELPVLVLQGELDPIGPTDRQTKLFTRLKTADKSWVVISGGDHAAFMERPRPHFIQAFSGFINRFNP
ncbi:alpha/beta hydrolase [Spongiimicrobium salis]|uniref:alpha/beta hydrolase n=1 Tax=Spongiimicrobium salis TaxID=1667022 RepID=UPI00374DF539